MSSSIPSPSRSLGAPATPRRLRTRSSRSVGSPAPSNASLKLSSVVDQFKDNNRESFALSPLGKSMLSDNTDIDMPRRRSWWRKVDHSRDVLEVLENNHPQTTNNVMEEFDVEVLSQEKKNYTLDMPESSGSESISSIVIPQRKLFTQKENQPQKMFAQVIGTRETLSQQNKTNIADKTANVAPKNLFGQGPKRSKPVFPAALLTISPDKTMANKTKEMAAELKAPPRNLFGGRPGTKRKNMFADFIVSESEDEISEIQPKMFAFAQNRNPVRHSRSMSRGVREPSPTSSLTTDIEMDDWKMLPSSTMVEHQLEAALATSTPGKRTRLSKLSEALESRNTNSTADKSRVSNKSAFSKNKSVNSPKSAQDEETNLSDKQERKSQTYTINKTKSLNKSKVNTSKTRTSQNVEADLNESGERHKSQEEVNKECQKEQESLENENLVVETNNAEQNELEMRDENEDIKFIAIKEQNEELKSRHHIDNEVLNESHEIENNEYNTQNEIELQNKHEESTGNKSKASNKSVLSKNKSVRLYESDKHAEIQNTRIEEQEVIQDENHEVKNGEKSEQQPKDIEMQEEIDNEEHNESEVEEQGEHYKNEEVVEQSQDIEENNERHDEVDNESHKLEIIEHEEQNGIEMQNENEQQLQKSTDNQFRCSNRSDKDSDSRNKSGTSPQLKHSEEIENKSYEKQETIQNHSHEVEHDEENEERHEEIEMQEEIEEIEMQDENEHGKYNDSEVEEQEHNQSEELEEQYEELNESQEVEDEVNEESQELENNEDEYEQENLNESQEENNENEVSQELENDEHENEQESLDESQEEENNDDKDELENLDESQAEDNENEESQEVENNDDEDGEQNEMSLHYESEEIEDENEELEASHEAYEEVDDNQDTDEAQHESDIEIDQDEIIDNSDGNHDADDVQNIEAMQTEEHEENPNVSHDTTGRQRNKKDSTKTPEAIVHDVLGEMDSFLTKGRNTSVRKTKSILKNFTLRPSIAPPRESSDFSDGTKNSSSERSEWDSHRTTRKTLRQTFGKDFTPRKSLRTLVMEKSAKRQTIMEANAKLHQANSTELPAEEIEQQNIDTNEETNYEDNAPEIVESTHEVAVSPRTRQTTLEMYMQKIKQKNLERKQKLEEQLRNSFKSRPLTDLLNFKVPTKPLRRGHPNGKTLKTPQSAPKAKRIKSNLIPLEDLPPELVEDMKYKPPKRFRPRNASWITNRLYKFLETKLEPKYDYKARVRAEALVEKIYNFVADTRRDRIAPSHMVTELKREMARLAVVKTHDDFYHFFHEYMPKEVNIKVIPDIINDIPLPREGVFTEITFH